MPEIVLILSRTVTIVSVALKSMLSRTLGFNPVSAAVSPELNPILMARPSAEAKVIPLLSPALVAVIPTRSALPLLTASSMAALIASTMAFLLSSLLVVPIVMATSIPLALLTWRLILLV